VIAAIEQRIQSRSPAELDECVIRWPTLATQSVTFVVTDGRDVDQLTWTFPQGPDQLAPADEASDLVNAGSGEAAGQPREPTGPGTSPVATVIADSGVWQAVLDGRANVITELRHGRLRCLNRRDAHRLRSDEVHAVAWLLGLAQVPLTHVTTA
jgi:hypothetical protein